MRAALSSLAQSLTSIRDVVADMDSRALAAVAAVRSRDATVRCACTVVISGYLEAFVKDCVQAFISEVCRRRISPTRPCASTLRAAAPWFRRR